MTPQTEINPVLEDLATLIRLIDRFPLDLKTHAQWLTLRAVAWTITDRLAWLARNWTTPLRCPSCGKPTTIDPRDPRCDAIAATVRVPKSGFRPKRTKSRAGRSCSTLQKVDNPTAL